MANPASAAPLEFPCPQCGKPSRWTDNPHRPFCCERCKLIDLGAWVDEQYRIPVKQGRDFSDEAPDYED